jgi:hypothetical protein
LPKTLPKPHLRLIRWLPNTLPCHEPIVAATAGTRPEATESVESVAASQALAASSGTTTSRFGGRPQLNLTADKELLRLAGGSWAS